jgi:SNF2 family DNA or RNA helicase
MANEHDVMYFRKYGLMPHQVHFASEFFKQNAQPYYLYATSHGADKMDLCTALCNYMLNNTEAKRILIIVPDQLCHIWKSTLTHNIENILVSLVDLPGFEKLKENVPEGENPWPESIVTILSMDTFKDEEVSKTLERKRWDLVLVDEAQWFRGQRSELLINLIQYRAVKRMLLITTIKREALLSLFPPDLFKMEWDLFVD